MAKRFTSKNMQQMYEACRTLAADRTSEFWHKDRPHTGAAHRCAYWYARAGMPYATQAGSLAYAAKRAGEDDRKRDIVQGNVMPPWEFHVQIYLPPAGWEPK